MRTPSGGLHAYFTGTDQRNGHLPAHHLDFRSRGGYVLTPPSQVDGKPYQLIRTLHGRGALDWDACCRFVIPHLVLGVDSAVAAFLSSMLRSSVVPVTGVIGRAAPWGGQACWPRPYRLPAGPAEAPGQA